MIIIYTLSGLLWSLIALAVGVVLFLLTGRALPAIVLPSIILIASASLNKKFKSISLLRGKPSIFFIPLFVYGIVGLLFSIFLGYALVNRDTSPQDQRRLSLEADYAKMDAGERGDAPELVSAVESFLGESEYASIEGASWTTYARSNENAALVICKNSKLKKLDETGKRAILDGLGRRVGELPELNGKAVYLGLKGLALYGAVKTPDTEKVRTTNDEPLLEYYGKEPIYGLASGEEAASVDGQDLGFDVERIE